MPGTLPDIRRTILRLTRRKRPSAKPKGNAKMRTVNIGNMQVPAVAVGCRRFNNLTVSAADELVRAAIDMGATYFDHADLYGGSLSEQVFGDVLRADPALRDKMFVQTKCGIRKAMNAFDLSKDYILSAVEGSLKRLGTDYLDVLLIHRMDALAEPEEIAEAFGILQQQGKVRAFGVSNVNPMQIELLKKYLHQDLVVNQMQLSLAHCPMIAQGIYTNMGNDGAIVRDGSILDYCRLHDIRIQTWSPLQFGNSAGIFIDHPDFPELNKALAEVAETYSVSKTTIAFAWLLRHPAKLMPISGSLRANRLADCVKAVDIRLTRDEWYKLFEAAGNKLPCNPQPGQATT